MLLVCPIEFPSFHSYADFLNRQILGYDLQHRSPSLDLLSRLVVFRYAFGSHLGFDWMSYLFMEYFNCPLVHSLEVLTLVSFKVRFERRPTRFTLQTDVVCLSRNYITTTSKRVLSATWSAFHLPIVGSKLFHPLPESSQSAKLRGTRQMFPISST